MHFEEVSGCDATDLGRRSTADSAWESPNSAEPSSRGLTPHERLRELTAILATGVHRLRTNRSVSPECGGIPAESPRTGLESVAGSCPTRSGLQRESAEVDDGD